MRLRTSIATVVALCITASLSAQDAALKLIPHDAGVAVVVRNLQELRKKGDNATAKLDRKDLRVSWAVDFVLQIANLNKLVDETRPVAILAVSTKSIGAEPLDRRFNDERIVELLVLAIPFKDRDAASARLGRKPGQPKDGELVTLDKNERIGLNFGLIRDKVLYLGFGEKAVKYAATAKPISDVLPANQLKILSQSDILVQLGTVVWGKAWEDILNGARKVFGEKMDEAEKEMGEKIAKSMEGVRFGIFGLRLDEERLSLTLVSTWEKENKYVAEVLGLLRYGDTPTDLRGLPAGNLLFAESAKGNGVANAMLARVLFKAALQDLLQTDEITTAAERPMIVGVFNEIWYNLLGNRTGLYQVSDEKKLGKIAMVSILDTADGAKFYKHFAELAKIGDGSLKPPALDVDQLIAGLSGKDLHKRELSMLKLRLAGLSVVPALDKAAELRNGEPSRRANKLSEEIVRLDLERRKARDSWYLDFRPTLEVLPQTETRKGVTVHLMKLKLPRAVNNLSTTLAAYLGPDWNKVRFAVVGKNVVMLLGSDTALFDEAVTNVKTSKPGLAESKYQQAFAQRFGPDRRVEFHLAMTALTRLFSGEPLPAPNPMAELSSLSLSVRPDSLQIDMWLPYDEVRPFSKLFPF